MAQVMIKIVKNLSLLRFDAPEWYPNGSMALKALEGSSNGKDMVKGKYKVCN